MTQEATSIIFSIEMYKSFHNKIRIVDVCLAIISPPPKSISFGFQRPSPTLHSPLKADIIFMNSPFDDIERLILFWLRVVVIILYYSFSCHIR